MVGALDKLVVIDFTNHLSGPYCAMILADQGADVIKVERPGKGDDLRQSPPHVNGEGAPFMLWNRNKRSIELDLKNPDDLKTAKELVKTADVMVENFRPGVAERIGIGYETMAELNPSLIYCSISGFGQTGPYSSRGGFDLVAQAMSGLMTINGPPEGGPYRIPIAISDVAAGMNGAIGILTALQHRNKTGEGQQVDVSLLDSALSMCVYEAANVFATGQKPERLGQGHRGSAPYQIFPTKDGWLALGASQQKFWEQTCEIIGADNLISDPRFLEKKDRVARQQELAAILAPYFQKENTKHWFEKLDALGIPCGPVMDHLETLSDPHIIAREMIAKVHHPKAGSGRTLGTPIKLSKTPGGVRRAAPTLGEHNDEVRDQLRSKAKGNAE
ncbi:MAG: CaiB/BaiF CoA transferase family protein [Alphaproteobacteria bacterium]|jgi:crotonobetainyl-CoA:carnitine CoA-transferase CaiB-like acyl-CoA transferase